MANELNERRLQVLSAIITDYVRTREPVGSRALVERYKLGVSPATIRNDMAALEEEGYICQPHTSAGRVPTEKGYRLFVDEVARVKPLSVPERAAITALLVGAVDLEQVVTRSVRVLAQLTGQLAVIEYPHLKFTSLRHLELVVLDPRRILLVVITDTARVEQRTIAAQANQVLDPLEVRQLCARLNSALCGQPAEQVPAVLAALLRQTLPEQRALLLSISDALAEALRPESEERLIVSGTANLARATPDFSALVPLLDAVEEQVVLLRLFAQAGASFGVGKDSMRVSIGSENHDDALAEASVVSAAYGASQGSAAHVGVIGPTRMDYSATMTAVCAVARYLSKFLSTSGVWE